MHNAKVKRFKSFTFRILPMGANNKGTHNSQPILLPFLTQLLPQSIGKMVQLQCILNFSKALNKTPHILINKIVKCDGMVQLLDSYLD